MSSRKRLTHDDETSCLQRYKLVCGRSDQAFLNSVRDMHCQIDALLRSADSESFVMT